MIPLRQHVASLVAVFLALAVGIALGGGLLGHDSDDDQGDSSTPSTSSSPRTSPDVATAFADAFAAAAAPKLYADGLNGHAVAVLALPGADPATIKALTTQVTAAGGAITGTFTVGDDLLDATKKNLVETQGIQLMTQLADARVDAAATTYDRMGELIGLAMATDQVSSVRADPAAVAIRSALSDSGLLTSPTDVRNAPLVLAVLPPGDQGATESLATTTILTGLVTGLAANAAGVVVTADAASAADGELASLRSGEVAGAVSTVDGLETTIGQVTTVLALVSVLTGTGGSYGASGTDGPVPLP